MLVVVCRSCDALRWHRAWGACRPGGQTTSASLRHRRSCSHGNRYSGRHGGLSCQRTRQVSPLASVAGTGFSRLGSYDRLWLPDQLGHDWTGRHVTWRNGQMLCYPGISRYAAIARDADYAAPRRATVTRSGHDGRQSRGCRNNCGRAVNAPPARRNGDDIAVEPWRRRALSVIEWPVRSSTFGLGGAALTPGCPARRQTKRPQENYAFERSFLAAAQRRFCSPAGDQASLEL